ncbi:MAG: sigma-70 family RNA polymerase sigma factor [Pseudomonadota bacterium]
MVGIWQATFSRARAALMRHGRTHSEAAKLVQEGWARLAYRELERAAERPDAFLNWAAPPEQIDAHRPRANRGEEVALDDVTLVDLAPSADAVLLGKKRVDRIAYCLARLPERTRETLLAHRVYGRTYTDIARELGISTNAVEMLVAEATLQVTCCVEGW